MRIASEPSPLAGRSAMKNLSSELFSKLTVKSTAGRCGLLDGQNQWHIREPLFDLPLSMALMRSPSPTKERRP